MITGPSEKLSIKDILVIAFTVSLMLTYGAVDYVVRQITGKD